MEQHYIGVDLHKAFLQVYAMTQSGARFWEGRYPRTPEGFAAFGARCDVTSAVAVEASGPTWHFVDAILPTGARVCVVDIRKTRLKAGFAAKTDRLDAYRLAAALRRDSVVSIYVPPPAIRALREVCRGRHQVVRLRTRVIQHIRALLLRSGVGEPPVTRLASARGLTWVAQVTVPTATELTLRRLERLLRTIVAEATTAETELRAHAAADPIAQALTTIVGVRRSWRSRCARRSGRSIAFQARANWPVTPDSCRGSRRAVATSGMAGSRARDRRGSAGRSSKSRCMRRVDRTPRAGGSGGWRSAKGC